MKARFFALVLFCATGIALAQTPPDRPPGPPNAEHQLDRLTTLLELTDTQKAQVKTILDAAARQDAGAIPGGPGVRHQAHVRTDASRAPTVAY